MLGPFRSAAQSGWLWASRALLPALKGRVHSALRNPLAGDRSLITGVVYGDGSACEVQDANLCVAVWELAANTGAGHVSVSGTLPFLIQDVDWAELFGLFTFLRIAHAPAQCVTDRPTPGEKPPRLAIRRGRTRGVTSGGTCGARSYRGSFLAMSMCHRSMAALSQSCHLVLCVNPVARASTDQFFTLCDVHLEHERVSQATCLQRRHE